MLLTAECQWLPRGVLYNTFPPPKFHRQLPSKRSYLLCKASVFLHGLGTDEKGRLGYVREAEARRLRPPAEVMGALDQYVDAVGADRTDEEGGEQAEQQAGVAEGHRHRQNAGAQAALQQMYQGVEVRRRVGELPVIERIVEGRLLVVRPLHERQRRAVRDGNRYLIFLALVSGKPTALTSRSCGRASVRTGRVDGLFIYMICTYACIYVRTLRSTRVR